MTTRRCSRTYSSPAQAQAALTAAREQLVSSPEEEPMHRYPHVIPTSSPTVSSCSEPSPTAVTQILEQLSCQNQLLVDLLGAVNSLTAALLCRTGNSG